MKQKNISPDTLRAIHSIFECGLALTDVIYTDDQLEEICNTFDEMYYEFMNKCKQEGELCTNQHNTTLE